MLHIREKVQIAKKLFFMQNKNAPGGGKAKRRLLQKAYEKEKENTQKSSWSDFAVDHAADHRLADTV